MAKIEIDHEKMMYLMYGHIGSQLKRMLEEGKQESGEKKESYCTSYDYVHTFTSKDHPSYRMKIQFDVLYDI